jgi:Tol biopolymer transport system component/DNA-binding winged helix-turn-helix (wHTH) protein
MPEQSFRILSMLLEHPGELVTREEIQNTLWPNDTVVEFENSINAAVRRLRIALGDSADEPRYVETLARRGYRLMVPIERLTKPSHGADSPPNPSEDSLAEGVARQGVPTRIGADSWKKRSIRWVVPMAVLLLIGSWVWFHFSRLASTLPSMKVIRLTSLSGRETEPTLSSDGKLVAFSWDGEGGDNRDIYIMQVDAGTPLRLTTNPGDDVSPTWSPDGRFVAFCRHSEKTGGIYLIASLGGPERKLAVEGTLTFGHLDWSPDGKFLVGSEGWPPLVPSSLFLLSVETGEKKRLGITSGGDGDFWPVFSPDGRTLAFSRSFGFAHEDIYTVPFQGGDPKRLTFDNRSFQPAWSPNGQEIIFSRRLLTGERQGLYRTSASGGSASPLVEGGQFGLWPSISRQGNRLVYSEGNHDSDIWRIDLAQSTKEHSVANRLIASTQVDNMPQFAPDGKKIVFSSGRSGSDEIWVCDSDGRNPVRLTSFGGPSSGTPRWSPDGKFIAFDSRAKGLFDIFVVSAEGGRSRCLTEENSDDFAASWSRDGQWIYFGSNRSGKGDWQLWKIRVDGGQPIRVTKNGGFEGLESFDGRFIYYSKADFRELWRVPVAGGEEIPFLQNIEPRYWTVTKQGIYFMSLEEGRPAVKFIDFDKRHVTLITSLDTKLERDLARGLDVSVDGRSLLCTFAEEDSSDIVLVENFH